MIWRAVPAMANRTKTAAVATYAQPKNGFLPPIQETVEMTIDLVPLYGRTGKSNDVISTATKLTKEAHTHVDCHLIISLRHYVMIIPAP